ncbi:unnamed protein product, partial [Rhizoctonia solani]
MTSIKVTRSGERVLVPPRLPGYLLETHKLKPIVGKPTDEDVKTIHAVIRSLNTVAHLPAFHDPDLSMQLSQHLFGAQMAVYQSEYSKSLLPGDQSVYLPPALPSHIPFTLERVVGVPSDENIKAAQNAVRDVDSLAVNPRLFDADLSMKLSQHLFNLQFARYTHSSAQGDFASNSEIEESLLVPRSTQEQQGPAVTEQPSDKSDERSDTQIPQAGRVSEASQESARRQDIMEAMKDTLDNINRMLMSIKRDQCMAYVLHGYQYWKKDPLNEQGVLASECGLPRLVYWYNTNKYSWSISLGDDHMAGYLKFFGIGAD